VVGCMIVKGILVQTVLGAPMERLALVKAQIGFTILNNVRKAMLMSKFSISCTC
jgi:hypothetical protein